MQNKHVLLFVGASCMFAGWGLLHFGSSDQMPALAQHMDVQAGSASSVQTRNPTSSLQNTEHEAMSRIELSENTLLDTQNSQTNQATTIETQTASDMRLFVATASKNGAFPRDAVQTIFASANFDSLTSTLPVAEPADIQNQLDIENSFSSVASAGIRIRALQCGSGICMTSFDYDGSDEANRKILDVLALDKNIKSRIVQPVLMHGQHQIRVILSYSNEIAALEI